MPRTTDFALLGPLEVRGPGGRIRITGPKERALLTVLAAWGGDVVSNERLTDALWAERPPRSNVKVLHNLVSGIRKALGPDTIETRPGGYLLRAPPDNIDVKRFDRLTREGRRSAGEAEWGAAAEAFSAAVALWRGPPLEELSHWPPACVEAARLEEQHRCVLEELAEAELANGHHAEVVASLEGLVVEEPLREVRWGLLMVALYRCGRHAEVMRTFQRARSALAELGLEPGPDLVGLERDLSRHVDTGRTAASAREDYDVPCPAAISATPAFAFAGRDDERRELRTAWGRAEAGERRTVLVGGESGAGKTRLAFELARQCASEGATVLLGTCDTELAMPYQPWVHVLDHLIRAMPSPVAASLQDELDDVRLLVPHLQRTTSGCPTPSPDDPGTEQYRLFTAVEALLADAARRSPVLVVIDDLHWASSQTLALLRHLAHPAATRLLLVGTFRDTRDEMTEQLASCLAELRRIETASRLALRGLDRRAVEQFVAAAVGHGLDPNLRAVASFVTEHSGGNAFYVNELWRHVVADGLLERDGDRWVVRSADVGVPDSVREVVAHRAKKLSVPAQRALELAAITGQQVDRRVLMAAIELPDHKVGTAIDDLVEARMLVDVGGTSPVYRFAHAIVRETVTAAIPPSERANLHRQAGEAIESVFAADRRPVYAELAGHFAAAAAAPETAAKATYYARRAASQAVDLVAYDEAVSHLTVALELSPPASEERVDILLSLGAADARQGLAREAMTAYGDAFRLARELDLMAQAVRAAAGFEEVIQLHGLPGGPAVEIVSRALGLLGEEDSPLRTRLQACLAMALTFDGRVDDADQIGRLAIASARRQGDPALLLAALKGGLVDLYDCARWVRVAQEMRQLASQIDDPWSLALSRSVEIRGLLMEGRIDGARAAVATFRRAVDKSRFVLYRYMGMTFDVMLSLIDGRFDDAERLADEAQDFGSSSGIESDDGVYGVHMYVIRREQGRLEEVAPVLRLASALEPDAPVWRPGLAALFVDTGMLEDAQREFEQLATDGFASLPRDAMWPCSLCFLAEVCVALGDRRRAELLYQELAAYRGFTIVVGYTVCLGPADRLLGSLAALLGRDDAEDHFAAALGLAERSGSPVWRAHVQFDWAVALGGRPDLLAAADATAHRFGMAALAERCRLRAGPRLSARSSRASLRAPTTT